MRLVEIVEGRRQALRVNEVANLFCVTPAHLQDGIAGCITAWLQRGDLGDMTLPSERERVTAETWYWNEAVDVQDIYLKALAWSSLLAASTVGVSFWTVEESASWQNSSIVGLVYDPGAKKYLDRG
jgi:hypothetical protein